MCVILNNMINNAFGWEIKGNYLPEKLTSLFLAETSVIVYKMGTSDPVSVTASTSIRASVQEMSRLEQGCCLSDDVTRILYDILLRRLLEFVEENVLKLT